MHFFNRLFCLVLVLLFMLNVAAMAQDKPAYKLYTKNGKAANYADMLKAAQKAEVILFGELHNNPINHWLQLQLVKDVYKVKNEALILGAEMFEADNQVVLNEYLAGLITEAHLEKEAKIWNNYPTDYKPIVDFAKEKGLNFIATNVPRRYASLVSKQGLEGLDSLSTEAKQWIAPAPVTVNMELPGYQNMMKMMGGAAHGGAKAENFVKAQAIKDATMAHFILRNFQAGNTFLHLNGSYHSNNYEGIYWYLKQQNEKLNIFTIAAVEQEDISKLAPENMNLADFIICIPSDMTKTY